MTLFVEPLITQHLWQWLEVEKGCQVDSEVNTGNGRIDLACKTGDGHYVGIELKADSGLSYYSTLSEQLWRYVDSGLFDEIYFASPEVGEATARLNSSTPEPLPGLIRNATKRVRAGVQAGHYDAAEAFDRIEREVDDAILSGGIQGGRPIRDFIRQSLHSEGQSSLEPVTLDTGIQELSRSVLPPGLGLLEVPLPLDDGLLRPEKALRPGGIKDPEVVRTAARLPRTDAPSFAAREEPQIRHAVWQELGGLPEGMIPNVMESEQRGRPIDLIAFEGCWDPTKIYKDPESGEIIGVEVKGNSSYSPKRLTEQLREYLETGVFSRLYLAVPIELSARAGGLLLNRDDLSERIGLLAVETDGAVTVEKEAPALDLQYDGYKRGNEVRKIGYGGIQIEHGQDVLSPFVLSEWREPLTDPAGKPVMWDYDPRETERTIRDTEELNVTKPTEVDRQLKPGYEDARTVRAYLLTGYSADPYTEGRESTEAERRAPKYGYVRLTVRDFKTEEKEYGIDLHFGRGSWEGGYICLLENQVDALVSVLSSLEHIDGGRIPGQGKYIDLQTFPFSDQENYEFRLREGDPGSEKPLDLDIEAKQADGVGAVLRIGEKRRQGVEVTMTETQRIDFLRTLRIMRYGRSSQIPGEGGYQRIGPNGNDTWDWETEVEQVHNPEYLGGPPPSQEKQLMQKWAELRDEAEEYAKDMEWGRHRCTRLDVADLLREGGRPKHSLAAYLDVAMLDVNGPKNRGNVSERLKREEPEVAKGFDADLGMIPPAVTHWILELKQQLSLTFDELRREYEEVVEEKWRDEFELTPEETWGRIKQSLREKQ